LHTVPCDSRRGRSSDAAADHPIANQHHPQRKRQCQPDFIAGTQQQNQRQHVTQNCYQRGAIRVCIKTVDVVVMKTAAVLVA
jgi:hypothetical protein